MFQSTRTPQIYSTAGIPKFTHNGRDRTQYINGWVLLFYAKIGIADKSGKYSRGEEVLIVDM